MTQRFTFITSFLMVIFIVACSTSPLLMENKTKTYMSTFGEDYQGNFSIRLKPITNREYLLFLIWNKEVYGETFPEYLLDLFPINSIQKSSYKEGGFRGILDSSSGVFKDYICNAMYIDYPVTGLTSYQLTALQKWLSDRYNENLMFAEGYLNFNPQQMNEDCFVLEPYLLDQYQGSFIKSQPNRWKNGLFVPNFRSPYPDEFFWIKPSSKNKSLMREYNFGKKDFLWTWSDYYLEHV